MLILIKGSLFKNCLVSFDSINNLPSIYLCYNGGHNLLSTPGYEIENIVKCYVVY